MLILGISAFYHDAAACLLEDGRLVCAVEEERLTRIKHDPSFPVHSIRYCLNRAGATIADIDVVAFYENPRKKISRQIWMASAPDANDNLRARVFDRLDPQFVERQIRDVAGYTGVIDFVDHHQAHAASSYYYSGFSDAAVMTIDGVGEWATTTYGCGDAASLEIIEEVHFPHSIGLLYSAVTSYLGFEVNEGEYKVMGLAPYGTPKYVDRFAELVRSGENGQYRLGLEFFDVLDLERMYTPRFVELFGHRPRKPGARLTSFHKDVARSLQVALEELLLQKATYLHGRVQSENLCMAGGVALNCVANARVLRDGPFRRLFVQPAAGDSGASLGAAALAWSRRTSRSLEGMPLREVFLGPSYDSTEIAALLRAAGVSAVDHRDHPDAMLDAIVDRLVDGKIVGWFDGALEFGPRALGARSILGDPRVPTMRERINKSVKMREAFRPFAPAVLADKVAAHFDLDHASPFMLETCRVISPLALPAITHVDGSARVQTVAATATTRFAKLLRRFDERTGCPILLNTSFNVRGEPMVCSPEDALLCFARSKIDTLMLQDFLIDRSALPRHWERELARLPLTPRHGVSHDVYAML